MVTKFFKKVTLLINILLNNLEPPSASVLNLKQALKPTPCAQYHTSPKALNREAHSFPTRR